jgi:hypothetical protein
MADNENLYHNPGDLDERTFRRSHSLQPQGIFVCFDAISAQELPKEYSRKRERSDDLVKLRQCLVEMLISSPFSFALALRNEVYGG